MANPRRPAALTDVAFLHRELQQLFERLAELDRASRPEGAIWSPSVDVYESRGRLLVEVEVPGLKPESVRVVVRDHRLHVTGERRGRPPSGVQAFLCMERPGGRFSRTIPLDTPVDLSQAQARLARGVLTIELPQLKDRRGRETEIPVQREG